MAAETKMQYVNLGKSGLKISKVILGAMSYGTSEWQKWVLDEAEALPLLKHAYDHGINTWDTADIYSHGRSEEIIGKALKQYSIPRNRVVILSKCYFGVADDGTQPPIFSSSNNDGEFLNRMAAWEFQMLQNIAARHGWHQFISMQNYHNLLYREEEREMIPYCKATGVGLVPWSPIARGALARPFDSRATTREQTDNFLKALIRSRETDVDRAIVGRVEEVAAKKGVSMAAVATAWCIGKGVNPIIGLGSKERIEEAVRSSNLKLTEEEVKYLEEPYLPKPIAGY
ncbi:putative aryl-alcohol dehydrogenase protein [Neofusicoccum parvum UCRNP2]|uniref:Putative aryl-alcohol dehydrogenase protein n=1 Tax=Botryosphaeria parva (strain UCR-NP2) TaxID=1287680 RepID=R1G590_BOTPV|nr:putative aryl-alcohol dehydrogenase protein [Neofusicoccum parvum UCRNP2]